MSETRAPPRAYRRARVYVRVSLVPHSIADNVRTGCDAARMHLKRKGGGGGGRMRRPRVLTLNSATDSEVSRRNYATTANIR